MQPSSVKPIKIKEYTVRHIIIRIQIRDRTDAGKDPAVEFMDSGTGMKVNRMTVVCRETGHDIKRKNDNHNWRKPFRK